MSNLYLRDSVLEHEFTIDQKSNVRLNYVASYTLNGKVHIKETTLTAEAIEESQPTPCIESIRKTMLLNLWSTMFGNGFQRYVTIKIAEERRKNQ